LRELANQLEILMPEERGTFELKQRTVPRVRAEAGHVVVRLELVSMRDPLDKIDFELALAPGYAEALGFELLSASKKLV
jgi:hypothetical protein